MICLVQPPLKLVAVFTTEAIFVHPIGLKLLIDLILSSLVQNHRSYVPLKICTNLSRLLTAPLKPTSKSYLWHLPIIGLLPVYLMAKSHLSYTPTNPSL